MGYPRRPDLPPTPGQIALFAAYIRTGSWAAAAHERGIKRQTAKNYYSELYARLGVDGALEAAMVLGWLIVPCVPMEGLPEGTASPNANRVDLPPTPVRAPRSVSVHPEEAGRSSGRGARHT